LQDIPVVERVYGGLFF